MIKYKIYLWWIGLLILCLSITNINAQDPSNLFNQANIAYQNNDFAKAVEQYEMVVQSGAESSALYFNLGNAKFQLGQLGAAVLYYEKAKKMNPTDKDILYNLKLANTRVVDEIEVIPNFFFVDWYQNLVQQKNTDFWAYCFSFCFVLSLLAFGLFYFITNRTTKKAFFLGSISMLFMAGCFYLMANSRYKIEKLHQEAIIFSENSYIKSAPSATSQDVFILHEGTKVKIMEEVDGWNEIILSDGKRGWTEKKNLRAI